MFHAWPANCRLVLKRIFMKSKNIFLIVALIGLFWPFRQAFLAGNGFSKRITAPVAPIKGRRGETRVLGLLNNSGVSYGTWLSRGKSYIRRKEYEQGILAFRKASYLRPADEEARFLLAWCYEKRGQEGLPGDQTDWDALAEQEYRAAVALADHLPARFNLALLFRRQKRFEEARRQLEHILLTGKHRSLKSKAEAELAAIFEQSMRPEHIAVDIVENDFHAE